MERGCKPNHPAPLTMKTILDTEKVVYNFNDLKSIEKAEKKKLKLENKGYALKHEFVNSITGNCVLTYETN